MLFASLWLAGLGSLPLSAARAPGWDLSGSLSAVVISSLNASWPSLAPHGAQSGFHPDAQRAGTRAPLGPRAAAFCRARWGSATASSAACIQIQSALGALNTSWLRCLGACFLGACFDSPRRPFIKIRSLQKALFFVCEGWSQGLVIGLMEPHRPKNRRRKKHTHTQL